MNEIATQQMQLPDTLEDLSKFVLVGREKLNAVRAEIRAIEKVQLAAEVHQQKLEEAQEIAEAVLDAETKLGELTKDMEQAQGQRTDLEHSNSGVTKSKEKQLADIGLSKMQTSRFETLASHPEQVEKAKADARAEGKIVTRQDVFHKIAAECYPNKTQEAARELKEAKKRAVDYQVSDGKVADFGTAKQHKEDNSLIVKEFSEKIHKAFMEVLHMCGALDHEILISALKASDKNELTEIQKNISDINRFVCKTQVKIEEVINEK